MAELKQVVYLVDMDGRVHCTFREEHPKEYKMLIQLGLSIKHDFEEISAMHRDVRNIGREGLGDPCKRAIEELVESLVSGSFFLFFFLFFLQRLAKQAMVSVRQKDLVLRKLIGKRGLKFERLHVDGITIDGYPDFESDVEPEPDIEHQSPMPTQVVVCPDAPVAKRVRPT